ncbi:hypothetical protein AU255_05505 [Methyloprofundus sedimenti]|uniref:Uncharacterized protein n=1 Tax=Methyloprofundus sedimenti TaxID=1420851 RepID=A0A1V8M714_9GAMM|nr:hypothetical protein [Methyloprofundus sedimenti]OQK17339.1 hypothetical protein AU255_05505 [Methyloprofundus sedimenti]
MKCAIFILAALSVSLTACQPVSRVYSVEKAPETSFNFKQLSEYGVKFDSEYKAAATEACTNYTKLYQQGDWRAGWILALQVTEPIKKSCVNSEEAIQILTTLENQNNINPELLWLLRVHLSWLEELKLQSKNVNQLKRAISRKQSQMHELEQENQDLVEKLEALKAIETSINL